ncbi:MBL fold metallo-hydrolase [Sporosarcina sp. G11-34]|uniref:MBL fold metallo-hydrolase n=1 Tax=Sporosarcina sp. G11-34 TaxID=2849605 RepID=UPI0022A93BCE|nr:MBL fold metallo-hydrolase [Sporosarcina sp. G11-34]MCZ2257794.1 MBL fold metallo-hydrolase [Sporosarcina sp. G11-34]
MKIKTCEDLIQAEAELSLFGQKLVVSVYLIDGLLIDTGPANKQKELIHLFEQWDIREVVLTHHHEDHTGTAQWIQKNKDVPVYIHETGIENCRNAMKLPLYRKISWGERDPFQPKVLGETFKTPNYTWDIIHTPGHADDHIALYNREKKWMFGGDLYIQSTPKSLFAFESIPTIIDSLKKMLLYDFDTYICSHKGVIGQGKQEVNKKLNYLLAVQKKVIALHSEGLTRHEIQKRMFPKKHPMHYFSLFENSPKHIITSILEYQN